MSRMGHDRVLARAIRFERASAGTRAPRRIVPGSALHGALKKETTVMTFGDSLRSALKQGRSLSDHARRTGGRSVMLGAVLLAVSTATVLATANTPAKIITMTANAA